MGTSLRSRWNRAFAALTVTILLAGLGGIIGTRVLVNNLRGSATRVEHEGTTSAQLRADIVTHAIVFSSPTTADQERQVDEVESLIRTAFARGIASEDSTRSRQLLKESSDEWEAITTSSGPTASPTDVATRGEAVAIGAPKVLLLLDKAGEASRAAVRLDLAHSARVETRAIAALAVLELFALVLVMHLARRLSTEVLQPVSRLRDSANRLAVGDLEHRVVFDRDDELGELSASFNVMADAIAGSQRSLTLQANTDSLSGLANRAAFRSRLGAVLARPERRSASQAVLFVDLDDFKDVNDTLGHAAGDEVLRVVSARLVDAVRPVDMVARLGGDEFALLLDGLVGQRAALVAAKRVVAALAEPVKIGEHWAHVGGSVGLAMRRPGSTIDGLMHEADFAMYAAKAKGKHRVECYDPANTLGAAS